VLFPRALSTDRSALVPTDVLDVLAAEGLYGLTGPAGAGGLGLADVRDVWRTVETLASGCLATTFVWAQHLGTVAALAATADAALRERWLPELCRGAVRAGVAFSALRRPGPPMLRAERQAGGWSLHGSAPWVSGWGRIDVIRVAARHGDDIVWALLDAGERRTLRAEPLELAALNASGTVTLHFDGEAVADDRVIALQRFDHWLRRDREGLRLNGSHALGVATRCARLMESSAWLETIDDARVRLDSADADSLPHERARASWLAMRCAEQLVVSGGGRSLLLTSQAQRLAREGLFLLVFGQTPAIRAAQLEAATDGELTPSRSDS
jgi:alkylation response protein AidB-like acyl-CoA dehydrogenase